MSPARLAPLAALLAAFPAATAYAEAGGSTRELRVTATVMLNCRLRPAGVGEAEVRCSRGALPRVEGCHGGCPSDPGRRAFGIVERDVQRLADGRRVVTVLF